MDGASTWASNIPLMSLVVAVFSAGVVVATVKSMQRDVHGLKEDFNKKFDELKKDLLDRLRDVEDDAGKQISEVRRQLVEKISELRHDHERSSGDQGTRIGELEAESRAEKRAAQVRLELTGRHSAIPSEVK